MTTNERLEEASILLSQSDTMLKDCSTFSKRIQLAKVQKVLDKVRVINTLLQFSECSLREGKEPNVGP